MSPGLEVAKRYHEALDARLRELSLSELNVLVRFFDAPPLRPWFASLLRQARAELGRRKRAR